MADWTVFLPVIAAIVATFGTTSLIFKIKYKKTEIQKNQHSSDGAVNVSEVTNSNITINTNQPTPIKSNSTKLEKTQLDENIRDLLKRIGKEKISNLLQEAKLVAHDTKDKEMEEWIKKELEGYEDPRSKNITRAQIKDRGLLPEYRDINGKMLIQIGDGSIHEMSYPVLASWDIKYIETLIEKIDQGSRSIIKYTFPKDRPYVGGHSGDIELPSVALKGIINGVERRLSKYLESKLIT